jgi:V8-like Glu-specific endopeptidase
VAYNRRLVQVSMIVLLVALLMFIFITPVTAVDCELPPYIHSNYQDHESSRLVIQYIEGTLYKWLECEITAGSFSIYMLEPEKRYLSEYETEQLFKASRNWIIQYENTRSNSEPASPSIASYPAVENIIDYHLPAGNKQLELNYMVDNRNAVSGSTAVTYPYYNSGFLTVDFNNNYMRGSGFMITPYVVLTNAHNVYSSSLGGWYTKITFSPGQYETIYPNAEKPYGTLSPVLAETNENYIYYEDNNERIDAVKYDYAALFFEETFMDITTFVPLEFNSNPTEVSLIGYPGVVKDANTLGMWEADGVLIDQDSHRLFYDAYSSGGSSGGPVLTHDAQSDSYRVVAIHSFASPGNFSGGPHLNDYNRDIIEGWMRWSPETTSDTILSLTLNKTSLTLDEGGKEALIATIEPQDSAGIELRWSSSNTAAATVDANGMVSALAGGNAIITVKTIDGGKAATCTVTVISNSGEIGLPGDYPSGDVNNDGVINVQDVTLVLQHVLKLNELDESALISADLNGDGEVNVIDVTLLMQFSLGLITVF